MKGDQPSPTHICKSCGAQGWPTHRNPSNFGDEVMVWGGAVILAIIAHWIFLFAALAFSLWRFTANEARAEAPPTLRDAV